MDTWRDRFNRMSGKTQIVVSRLFVHLAGNEVAPLLGVLNQSSRQAVESDGDLESLGGGLVEICQALLQYETYWQAAANEGDVFFDEGDAGDYVTELFTDSAQRYGSTWDTPEEDIEAELLVPVTQHVVVMLTIACEGQVPALETDLGSMSALRTALKTIINLHYDSKLRAIQVHFSPAQFGDELTSEQLIQHYPELVPL
ncbi:MAG: DUF1517 domain-containing protein [Leptolyngbyaceae cyanobacterium CRU_2_3]|nr:DUF1517 domain-containing protein [Leptolyngbyaceae cyanobacterium CRU_2_3]